MTGEKKTPFCVLPFTQVSLYPGGRVTPCCLRSVDVVSSGITPENLKDAINRPEFQKLREEFLTGQVKTCAKDIANRKCNEFYAHLEPYIEKSKIISTPLKRIELRLNGHCNLKCTMCSMWEMQNGYYDRPEFWAEFEAMIPHLKEAEILGGEPFIQKDTFKMFDLFGKKNPDCPWLITTNAHWKFNDYIKSKLDLINIRRLTVSIDSLDADVYPKIRVEGDLKVVLKTLDEIIAYRNERKARGRGFEIVVACVLQQQNLLELENYIAMAAAKGIIVHFIYLEEPPTNSISRLDAEIKTLLIDKYTKLQKRAPIADLSGVISAIQRSL